MLKFRGFRGSHSTRKNCALEIDLKPHPFIIAACSVAKNQLLLSLIKSLYRYFTANKDPSGPLSRIVPSSSIKAANTKVRIQRRRRLIPIIVCMVVLPLQWASKRCPRTVASTLKAILQLLYFLWARFN